MSAIRNIGLSLLALFATVMAASLPASAQQQKPNILFIMGDDIGWIQPSIYHEGLGVGETPNIDRADCEEESNPHCKAPSQAASKLIGRSSEPRSPVRGS